MELERTNLDRLVPLEVRAGKVRTVLVHSRSPWDSARYCVVLFHKNVTCEGVPP